MLPNLSLLRVTNSDLIPTSTDPPPGSGMQRKRPASPSTTPPDPKQRKEMTFSKRLKEWETQLKALFGNDITAGTVGFRCEPSLDELLKGPNFRGNNRIHMAFDEFHGEYGRLCAVFSTRALQEAGFVMGQGNRWGSRLFHYEEDPWLPGYWRCEELLDLWLKCRREHSEERDGWKDKLKDRDRFKEPTPEVQALLKRYENREWTPHNPETEDDYTNFWKDKLQNDKKSVNDYETLFNAVVDAAPWWVLAEIGPDVNVELLEFTVLAPNNEVSEKMKECMLFLVDDTKEQVLYELDLGETRGHLTDKAKAVLNNTLQSM